MLPLGTATLSNCERAKEETLNNLIFFLFFPCIRLCGYYSLASLSNTRFGIFLLFCVMHIPISYTTQLNLPIHQNQTFLCFIYSNFLGFPCVIFAIYFFLFLLLFFLVNFFLRNFQILILAHNIILDDRTKKIKNIYIDFNLHQKQRIKNIFGV